MDRQPVEGHRVETRGPSDSQSGMLQESDIGLHSAADRERGEGLPDQRILGRSVTAVVGRSAGSDVGHVGPTMSRREWGRSVSSNSCPLHF